VLGNVKDIVRGVHREVISNHGQGLAHVHMKVSLCVLAVSV
jgi:hypothetical protein